EACRITDNEGTEIYLDSAPYNGNADCTGARVTRNLISGYGNGHMKDRPSAWSDGISNRCPSATIEDNDIVDVTDIGVVTFHPGGESIQASVVRRNRILALGNPMVAAIGIDPETGNEQRRNTALDYSKFVAEDNQVWTSDSSHIDIVLAIGTRSWFADGFAL